MNAMHLFRSTNYACAALITKRYSTSFSMGIRLFQPKLRGPIEAIYGFVRYADEIVDTFHEHDKKMLLDEFRAETYKAIERKISLNPVLDCFQEVVHEFGIERDLIDAFLKSMEMDLEKIEYSTSVYNEYIYGSAEVVGLMCLKVFTEGNQSEYLKLKAAARSLGAAFQKVNFLRDLKDDYVTRGRTYFPDVQLGVHFSQEDKALIEADIKKDFDDAFEGIKQLPRSSRLGVLSAYYFYLNLFRKISHQRPEAILKSRIRISNFEKVMVVLSTAVRFKFNLL